MNQGNVALVIMGGQDDAPSPDGTDLGLRGLALLAQFHGIAADAGQLAHEYCRKGDSFDETTLLLVARKLGLKAQRFADCFARLPMASLPAMGWGRDGNALKAWLLA